MASLKKGQPSIFLISAKLFQAGHPLALFKLISGACFAMTPDPKRFLVEKLSETARATDFITITDWSDDLCRRALQASTALV